MPLVFTKSQIRHYLSEMGYENVPDDQLEDFMKDLKKLVRHDEKVRKSRQESQEGQENRTSRSRQSGTTGHDDTGGTNRSRFTSGSGSIHSHHSHDENVTDSNRARTSATAAGYSSASGSKKQSGSETLRHLSDQRRSQNEDIFEEMRSLSRDSQQQKEQSESIRGLRGTVHDEIVTHYQRPTTASGRSGRESHDRSHHSDRTNEEILDSTLRSSQQNRTGESGSLPPSSSSSLDSASISSSQSSEQRKPKINIPDYIKRDPVALYHYYKIYWSKHKTPGSDNHMQLRWNVRAGTMGRVPCTPCGERVNYLTR